ncbi:MAG: hypothetical protein CBC13_10960 [Planctomycetia bacterium TMED53]|nr:MAG: hypothetical protein CBC13_10960 [Planctomycetia bacterium TMED53]
MPNLFFRLSPTCFSMGLALFISFSVVIPVNGQSPEGVSSGKFVEQYTISTGASYKEMEVADLNNDLRSDLVLISTIDSRMAYFETSPQGVLELQGEYSINHPSLFQQVVMIDFNLDGTDECVLFSDDGTVLYLEPQGSGFNEVVLSIPNRLVSGLHVADLDGDGFNDLILTTLIGIVGGGNTYVMTSAGNPELTLHSEVFPDAYHVEVADIGNDGDLDLYMVSWSLMQLYVLENLGSMNWSMVQTVGLPTAAAAIEVGDIILNPDLERDPDVLMFPVAGNGVYIYTGSTDGTLSGPTFGYETDLESASGFALANLESYGSEDLLYLNGVEDQFQVLKSANSLDGIAFSGLDHYDVPVDATCLVVADINGDNALDVVVASESQQQLVVFHGRDPEAKFSRGDVNRDGSIDIADPILSLQTLFIAPDSTVCMDSADCDDNGLVDLGDPIILLSYIFVGGVVIPEPFGECDSDSTEDLLECSVYEVQQTPLCQ